MGGFKPSPVISGPLMARLIPAARVIRRSRLGLAEVNLFIAVANRAGQALKPVRASYISAPEDLRRRGSPIWSAFIIPDLGANREAGQRFYLPLRAPLIGDLELGVFAKGRVDC